MWSSPSNARRWFSGLVALSFFSTIASPVHADDASRTPGVDGLHEVVLSIRLNRQDVGDGVVVLRDRTGQFLIAAADLAGWRMALPNENATIVRGEPYHKLAAFAGLVANFDGGTQSLTIDAPPSLFTATRIDAIAPQGPKPDRTARGGFLNYDVLATHADRTNIAAGAFEMGVFGRWGTVTNSAVGSVNGARAPGTRLESTWTYAMPERLATVRVGDVISRPGASGHAMRLGGVQYGSDFGTDPTLVLTPGQFVAGAASIPSSVDVFVNNALVAQQQVAPGPFSVTNIAPVTGGGDLRLVIRDELGRERIITRPFYSSPMLLRPGLIDFSFTLGFARENFGLESADYGAWRASATYRRGLKEWWTGEVHAQAQAGVVNAGIASDVLLGRIGIVSGSLTAGQKPEGSGSRASAGFSRQSSNVSFAVSGNWTSQNFIEVGDTTRSAQVAREWLASGGWWLGPYGTLSAAYVSRAYRDQPRATIASVGHTIGIDRWGFLGISLSHARAGERSTNCGITWTLPLSANTSATLGYDRTRPMTTGDERSISIQRDLPPGEGFSYRVRASDAGPKQAAVGYQNNLATMSAELATFRGQTAARVEVSGGIGFIEGNTFFSRAISDSFGLVQIPGYPGVRVYSENQEIGVTGSRGELIVPRLLPYQRNTIRIEQADLPFSAEVDGLTQDAVPYLKAGVVIRFPVRHTHAALMRILTDSRTPVPAGAVLRLVEQDGSFPVVMNGDAYVSGLAARNRAVVTWGAQECAFDFDYPESVDPQPRLGPFVCHNIVSAAL